MTKYRTEIVTITPEIAQKWLDERAPNREKKPGRIQKWARAMLEGQWIPYISMIMLVNGRMWDGQHRLWAIIEAGVPVDMLVMFLETDDQHLLDAMRTKLDIGAVRTAPDIMFFRGTFPGMCHKNVEVVAAACRQIGRLELSVNPVDAKEHSTGYAHERRGTLKSFMDEYCVLVPETFRQRGALAAAWYAARHVDVAKANQFVKDMFMSAAFAPDHPAARCMAFFTSPPTHLRRSEDGNEKVKQKAAPDMCYGAFMHCFKARQDGVDSMAKVYPTMKGGVTTRTIRTTWPKVHEALR